MKSDHPYEKAINQTDAAEAARRKAANPARAKGDPPGPPLPPGAIRANSEGMDPWQQSIEDRVEGLGKKIDSRFIWLLGAFAAGFLALGTLILNRTDALGVKVDSVAQRVSDLGERTARVEARLPTAK